ncbi:hypothetical protein Peur_039117 [Populus x canadensis]
MGPVFFALDKLKMLRISIDEEVAGLDISSPGGYAYPAHPEESHPRFCADYMRIALSKLSRAPTCLLENQSAASYAP